MTLAPKNTKSNIRDPMGGGGAAGAGVNRGKKSLQGYAAAVHLTVHDSKGRKLSTPIWAEIWACDGTTIPVGQSETMLFIDSDKFAAGSYQGADHPGQLCVKVHDAKKDWADFSVGVPGNPVVASESITFHDVKAGDIVEVEVVLDRVTDGKLDAIVASMEGSLGYIGTQRYSTQTWTMAAKDGVDITKGITSKPDGTKSFIRGCKKINLTCNTTPPNLPVLWKVLPIKEKDPKAAQPADAPKLGTDFGRWSWVSTDVAGGWVVGASSDDGKTWTFWPFEIVDVKLKDPGSVGGSGPMDLTFSGDSKHFSMGFLSGKRFFSDKSGGSYPGATDKGFYAKATVTIAPYFAETLDKVDLAVIQNVPNSTMSINTHATYDDNLRQYHELPGRPAGVPALDGPMDGSDPPAPAWMHGSSMFLRSPTRNQISQQGYSAPCDVTVEFCDSPGPFFDRKRGDKKIQSQMGTIDFKSAIVARTDDMKSLGWVAIAETTWSVELAGTIKLGTSWTMDDPDTDSGTSTSKRNPGGAFAAIGPKDIGKGFANYEVNGPVVLDAWKRVDHA